MPALQRARLMLGDTFASSLSSQTSSLPLLRSVSIIDTIIWPLFIIYTRRLACNEDIPSERVYNRGNMCQHAEERLEIDIRHWPHPRDRQMPSDLPQSRICSG
jgi:hypothetical protein